MNDDGQALDYYGAPPTEKEYRMWQGNAASVQKNFEYLTRPGEMASLLHPEARPYWCAFIHDKKLFASKVNEYAKFYVTHYGPIHAAHAAKKYNPYKGVNWDSSPGALIKDCGFKKKRDFYNHPLVKKWFSLNELLGPSCNWLHAYTASPKKESTAVDAINKNKSRIIYVADVYDDFIGRKYCKNYNDALKDCDYNKVGKSITSQSKEEMRDEMMSNMECFPPTADDCGNVIEDADCTKYDVTHKPEFFDFSYYMRCKYIPPHLPRTPLVLKWFYSNALQKNLVWLDGTIIVTCQGMPSGCRVTCEDNTQTHHFVLYDYWRSKGYSDEQILVRFCLWIVSDDRLAGVPKDVSDLVDEAKHYAGFGRILKELPGERNRTMDNKTFCGITWLPNRCNVVAPDKSLHAINKQKGKPFADIVGTAYSVARNLADDPVHLEKARKYIKEAIGLEIDMDVLLRESEFAPTLTRDY